MLNAYAELKGGGAGASFKGNGTRLIKLEHDFHSRRWNNTPGYINKERTLNVIDQY